MDVDKIVAGLSEAQRAAIICDAPWSLCNCRWSGQTGVCALDPLQDLGIYDDAAELTPLGKQVRNRLREGGA